MTTAAEFRRYLVNRGFDFFAGIPDSTFGPLFGLLAADPNVDYVPAATAPAAVAAAVGAALGGRQACVVMENSGLAEAANVLASLPTLYQVPLLLVVGWRGHPGEDAPEHEVVGRTMPGLMSALGIPFVVAGRQTVRDALDRIRAMVEETRAPCVLAIKPGVIG